jgi:hypothetical protein
MKKFYAFAFGLAIAGSISAQKQLSTSPANKQAAYYNPFTDRYFNQLLEQDAKKKPIVSQQTKMISTEEVVGGSFYDLQSNNSVGPRIIADANGVAATWIFGPDGAPTGAARGTGYNFRNPATNAWDDLPSARIEGVRTGWPSLLHLGNGSEVVIAHDGVNGINMISRPAVGTGAWGADVTIPSNVGEILFWPRACAGGADGNTIHMIAITDPNDNVQLNGMESTLLYFRSTNGGTTWDLTDVLLPEIDTDHVQSFTADTYAIHARGNKVVIGVFDNLNDSYVFVSEDNGTTWEKIVVWDFAIDNYVVDSGTDVEGDGIQDTLMSADGTGAVYIDAVNNVHAAFGTMFYTDDLGVVDSSWSYFPLAGQIAYWNSNMEPLYVGQDSTVVGTYEEVVSIDTVYSTEIDTIYTTYGTSVWDEPFMAVGGGPDFLGEVVPSGWTDLAWDSCVVFFEVDNGSGAMININGTDYPMGMSGTIDLSNAALPDGFVFSVTPETAGTLNGLDVIFYGTYTSNEVIAADTVYVISTIDTVFSTVNIYEVVDVFNFNDVVMVVGESPDVDPAVPTAITEVGQYGGSGVASHPQIAGDANGGVYVSFAAVNENFFNQEEYLRHIWISKSTDSGISWDAQVDVTPDLAEDYWEYMYASMSPDLFNDKLHLVIQRDIEPGIFIQPEDVADPNDLNDQIYLCITSDLEATFNANINESVQNNHVLNPYPNPSNSTISLNTEGLKGAAIMVYDVVGQLVYQGNVNSAREVLDVQNWNAGVYQVVVQLNGQLNQTAIVVE